MYHIVTRRMFGEITLLKRLAEKKFGEQIDQLIGY